MAKQIGDPCENVEFFYLSNHGIDLLLIDRVYQQTERFFSQPIEEKMKLYIGQCSYGNNRGYTPIYKEGFDLALELLADDQSRSNRTKVPLYMDLIFGLTTE